MVHTLAARESARIVDKDQLHAVTTKLEYSHLYDGIDASRASEETRLTEYDLEKTAGWLILN